MDLSFALMTFVFMLVTEIELALRVHQKMIVCYFTNWSQYREGVGQFLPEHIDPQLCTHVFFAFSRINPTMNTIEPIEWNYATVLHAGIMQVKAKKPDLKLVLSLGGYNALNTSWLSASHANNVHPFARNVVTYLRKNQFDGLSIDWETPEAETKGSYLRLVQALRTAFDGEDLLQGQEKLLLSTDVAANKEKVPFYSPQQLAGLMDYVIIMAYDFYGSWSRKIGHHSPLFLSSSEPPGSFFSQHQAVEMWREAGIPMNKLLLGLASYGRSLRMVSAGLYNPGDVFNGQLPGPAPYTKESGFYAYYEVCGKKNENGWTEVFMADSRVPYVYSTSSLIWAGYDNARSITEKTIYAVSRGMAGVMLWSLDFDDFRGSECGLGYNYPLLRAINQVIASLIRCTSDADCRNIPGVCVAGFCGCPQGSFISTKSFCTVSEPTERAVQSQESKVQTRESNDESFAVRTTVDSWCISVLCIVSLLISIL